MMIRPFGVLLRTLPVAATLALATGLSTGFAIAQTQAAEDTQTGPLDGLIGLFQSQARAQPVNRDRIDSEGLPPPGFATPDGGPPPMGNQPVYQFSAPPPGPGANAQPDQAMRPPGAVGMSPAGAPGTAAAPPPVPANSVMTLPPEDQPEQGQPKELPPNLKKQMVEFSSKEPAGTIIIDTPNTYLYLVLGNGKALRYGIGVGREGFTWSGTERVSKMAEWPDWHPPAEMIDRQPYLPRFMAGGPGNPLGGRALYLGKTLYRIHGTNQPSTIGQTVSSGCIRLLNEDIEDLFSRVQVGSRVVVMPGKQPETVANAAPPAPANPMAPPSANRMPNSSPAVTPAAAAAPVQPIR